MRSSTGSALQRYVSENSTAAWCMGSLKLSLSRERNSSYTWSHYALGTHRCHGMHLFTAVTVLHEAAAAAHVMQQAAPEKFEVAHMSCACLHALVFFVDFAVLCDCRQATHWTSVYPGQR
jgi:hypothetical protein